MMRPLESLAIGTAIKFDEAVPEGMLTGIPDLASFKSALRLCAKDRAGVCYMMKAGGTLRTARLSNHSLSNAGPALRRKKSAWT